MFSCVLSVGGLTYIYTFSFWSEWIHLTFPFSVYIPEEHTLCWSCFYPAFPWSHQQLSDSWSSVGRGWSCQTPLVEVAQGAGAKRVPCYSNGGASQARSFVTRWGLSLQIKRWYLMAELEGSPDHAPGSQGTRCQAVRIIQSRGAVLL